MNLDQAREIVGKIVGQSVRDYRGRAEYARPSDSWGKPGRVFCTGEIDCEGYVCVEFSGWPSDSSRRSVADVVLPRGVTRAKLAKAVDVIVESM